MLSGRPGRVPSRSENGLGDGEACGVESLGLVGEQKMKIPTGWLESPMALSSCWSQRRE